MKAKKSQLILKRRKRRLKIVLIILGIVLLFFLIYWFIFLSNFFQIKEVNILNSKEENQEELLKEVNQYFQKRNTKFVPLIIYKVLPQTRNNYRNMLLFSKEGLAKFIKNNHPEIKQINASISVSKQILTIEVIFREIEYLFCEKEECYLVDKVGVVFEKAPSVSGSLIKIINSPVSLKIKLGSTLFTKDFWQKIDKYYFLFDKPDSPLKIRSIIIDPNNLNSIKIKTEEGWFLYLDLKENPEYILKIVSQIKEERNLSKIEYLDCRFLPKIYLK
ncbi:MAG: cell division protein FtsQ/DivIB [Minisyncoccia bacterium]